MATFTKKLSGDDRYSITLTVTEQSTSVSDNSSVVYYKLEATKSKGTGYYTSNTNNPYSVTINGTKVKDSSRAYDFTGSTPKTITLTSGTTTVKHESDGTKTISCKGYFKDANNSLGSATVSGSLTLTPLHTPPLITGYTITETNTVLTNIGVQNNEFVSNLSQKSIDIAVTYYDDASLHSCYLYYEGLLHQSLTNPMAINFATFPTNLEKNTFDCAVYVEDTQGAYSYYSNATGSTQSKPTLDSYTLIPYIKPTFTVTSNAKRDGQTSGKVDLNIDGVYFNGEIGSGSSKVDQGGTYKPIVKYKFWKYGETEPSTYAYTIPDSSISTSNGTFSVADYPIGNATEGATNHFDPDYAYRVKLYVQDTFANTESIELSIPVGEATWTEYRDRVDFKKLTITNKEILAPYTLYDGNASRTDKSILLNDSASNYKMLEIFYNYYNTDDAKYKSTRVYEPNGKVALIEGSFANATYLYFESARYTISGTNLTRTSAYRWRFRTDGNATRTDTTTNDPSIWITRVVGYK